MNIKVQKEIIVKKNIDFETLSKLLIDSFAQDDVNNKRRYPSAGNLYTVTPILVYLDTENLEMEAGSYVLDTNRRSLKLIEKFEENKIIELSELFYTLDKDSLYSNYLIAYAVNFKKTLVKYKRRGYRFALIEIGAMCQVFRETIRRNCSDIGELCWSGFDDNALTYILGLNPRDFPVALVQWFGK